MRRFLGLTNEEAALERAKWVVLPAAYERTTTYVRGCRRGPRALINASQQVELYDERLGQETYLKQGIHTASSSPCQGASPEAGLRRIEQDVGKYLAMGKKVALLGGEHTVSLPAVRACREKHPSFTVLSLDAHADLRDSYQGSTLNHACVSRRLLELVPVVVAGVRSISAEELPVLREKRLSVFLAHQVPLNRPGSVTRIIRAIKTKAVYLSIDVDVFDPAVMPAVGTPEPGGATYDQVVDFLKLLCHSKRVIGFDLVELCPRRGDIISDFTAAKLVYHLIGLIG